MIAIIIIRFLELFAIVNNIHFYININILYVMTDYHVYGLALSKNQIQKIATAAKKQHEVKIRLSKNNLNGNHKLPLTQRQINRIKKTKTGIDLLLSVSQLQHLEKTGGFIPLLALLLAIFGGLGAAGLAVGIANAVSIAKNAKAVAAAQTEI